MISGLVLEITDLGTDTLIEFGASGDSVTLLGFADPGLLTDGDFIFA